ncbi:MAG TPA: YtoQ family protein, partial [Metabacillus sp.]|nr:YtoQ family protein [Metabacillus sp.]
MEFIVYLAGEIHTNWREQIKNEASKQNLPYHFVGPMENHSLSDNIGEQILGKQPGPI